MHTPLDQFACHSTFGPFHYLFNIISAKSKLFQIEKTHAVGSIFFSKMFSPHRNLQLTFYLKISPNTSPAVRPIIYLVTLYLSINLAKLGIYILVHLSQTCMQVLQPPPPPLGTFFIVTTDNLIRPVRS